MENNLENKAKFFLMHFKSEAIWRNTEMDEEIDEVTWEFKNFEYLDETDYLELKPISSIKNNELTSIVKFYEPTAHNVKLADDQIVFDFIYGDQGASGAIEISDGYCQDWLRSYGFATEWMGLSVEKQIEYGWVKLKEN